MDSWFVLLLLAAGSELLDEVWKASDTSELLGKPLLELLPLEAEGTLPEEKLEMPEVDVLDKDAEAEVVTFNGENEVVVVVILKGTLELKANKDVADTVNVPDVVVELADRLKVVELVRPEVVIRLARRLEAEADDELGAAVDTPTLSALMISAAFWYGQHASIRAARCANSPFLQQRRQRLEDAPQVS